MSDYVLRDVSSVGNKFCFAVVSLKESAQDSFEIFSVNPDLSMELEFSSNEEQFTKYLWAKYKVGIQDDVLYLNGVYYDKLVVGTDTLYREFRYDSQVLLFNLIYDLKKDSVLYLGSAYSVQYNRQLQMDIDNEGNLITVAKIWGPIYVLNNDSLYVPNWCDNKITAIHENVVIYKLSKEGKLIFINGFLSGGGVSCSQLGIDDIGNMYLGILSSDLEVYYGPEVLLEDVDKKDIGYLLKLNPKGEIIWKTYMRNDSPVGKIEIFDDLVMFYGDTYNSGKEKYIEIQGQIYPFLANRSIFLVSLDKSTGQLRSYYNYVNSYIYSALSYPEELLSLYGLFKLSEFTDEDFGLEKSLCVFNRVGGWKTLGIAQENRSTGYIYPNPISMGESIGVSSESKIKKIKIYDIFGNLLLSYGYIKENEASVSTKGLKRGVYFIYIETQRYNYAERLVVE